VERASSGPGILGVVLVVVVLGAVHEVALAQDEVGGGAAGRRRRVPDEHAMVGRVCDDEPAAAGRHGLGLVHARGRAGGGVLTEVALPQDEIGRLRELSFRQVGEGTGRSTDIDRFDTYYIHLFVWDRPNAKIVGAYRLGPTDQVLVRFGRKGLYTSTLFHLRRRLLEQMGPALELGRSFVHPDYQKSYAPLMLLWKGIGHYVAARPRYRHLFGCVSISANYTSMSKQLLMSFLRGNEFETDLSRLLKPKNPPRLNPPRGWKARDFSTIVGDLNDVNQMVSELEQDGKTMPVLLRQYLKLNAKLLGFNVDPDFGDVLDGLMLFDLPHLPKAIGERYLGKQGFANLRDHHGIT